eukprot:Hpha_TRINITY_DN16610_c2_g5::TRINITY_DN16610_c2_g5_i1::g.179914::m.179914
MSAVPSRFFSRYVHAAAASLRLPSEHETLHFVDPFKGSQAGEDRLWRLTVSWGVSPMPNRVLAVVSDARAPGDLKIIGAMYYDVRTGFLSALAVLKEYRRLRIGKLLICGAVGHVVRGRAAKQCSLHVLGCDASVERDALYTGCGFEFAGGGKEVAARRGGNYVRPHSGGLPSEDAEQAADGEERLIWEKA